MDLPRGCLLGGNTSALHVQGHATRLLQGRSTKVFKRARLGDEALSFKRGVLKPNTWKPKLRYVKTDDELAWTLPAGGIVLGKSYKIKWRVHLGGGVASGTELPLTVSVAEWMEDLVVSVK
ncbi:hypothetical protein Naga_100424g5 [Nannochloropsis gaditana]|uniref:Uncharacterized protein n=1 Tax=Nannochloropsis gaditana TaxID=72520 RepID=W7T3H2_9STRA|nr:hypothetical protein Naga_100424g5 [Nannochloropsis gaditana]